MKKLIPLVAAIALAGCQATTASNPAPKGRTIAISDIVYYQTHCETTDPSTSSQYCYVSGDGSFLSIIHTSNGAAPFEEYGNESLKSQSNYKIGQEFRWRGPESVTHTQDVLKISGFKITNFRDRDALYPEGLSEILTAMTETDPVVLSQAPNGRYCAAQSYPLESYAGLDGYWTLNVCGTPGEYILKSQLDKASASVGRRIATLAPLNDRLRESYK